MTRFRRPMQEMLGNEQQSVSRHKEYSNLEKIGKYLIHGFVFSIMTYVADIVLVSILTMLIFLASFLGILIWLGLVFLTWGWVNGMLCSWLWRFRVKQQWTSLMGHGFAMILVLLIIQFLAESLLQFVTTGISAGIYLSILLASLSIIDGVIGKAIGGLFKKSIVPARGHIAASRPYYQKTDVYDRRGRKSPINPFG